MCVARCRVMIACLCVCVIAHVCVCVCACAGVCLRVFVHCTFLLLFVHFFIIGGGMVIAMSI